MDNDQSLSHTKWECLSHLVWIPNYRKKKLCTGLRKDVGAVFRELARRKECAVLEGPLLPDHVHLLVSVPPKYAVSQIVGSLKGTSAS